MDLVNMKIHDKDIMKDIWKDIYEHVDVTHHDKYCDGDIEVVDFIASKNMDFFTGGAVKYICRYISKQGNKTGNKEDLLKAIHLILMKISMDTQNDNIN